MGGGSSGIRTDNIGNFLSDTARAVVDTAPAGFYANNTEEGRKIKGATENYLYAASGEKAKDVAAAEGKKAQDEQAKREAQLKEQEMMKESQKKQNASRAKQKALQNSGRSATILTSPLGAAGGGQASGKTLLGS